MTDARSEFVVRTKLRMPRSARAPIVRDRIVSRLGATLSPFTLVSAPAGFGKTTLVTQLLSGREEAVAWYQIDRLDSDPRRFLAHLIAAVQEEIPAFGQDHLEEVLRREVGADRRDVVRFINAVVQLARPLVLVLDDYHEIDGPPVHGLVSSLLEDRPPELVVVMATRTEPALPLGRLRARNLVSEVRTEDLRFDDREALAFVRETLALDIPEPLVVALNRRTEGWVAGLQLAGLSLRDADDVASIIATFDGRERLVTDYLVEEVLDVQPPEIRHFLCTTSILERMNAPLAVAVSGIADGQAILQHLERHNMFVVALDRRREWYRYHHLFGDLLRRQLGLQDPALLATCHARASDWFAERGMLHDAMEHALAIPDDERAARLLEDGGWRMIETMESRQVSAWSHRIGAEALGRNLDRLAIALAADILIGDGVDRRWLERAERLGTAGNRIGNAHANLLAWARSCALTRERRYAEAAAVFSAISDADDESVGGNLLLSLLPPLCRATAAWWRRDLALAERSLEHSIRVSLDAGAGAMYFPAVLNLFEVHRLRGDAAAASSLLERAGRQARGSGWTQTVGMGWLRFAEGEQGYSSNALEAAESAYRSAIDLTRFAGSNTVPLLAAMRIAMILHLRGDPAGALVMANEIAATTHRPNASFVAGLFDAMLVHMWLVLGRVDEAGRALAPLDLAPDDERDPSREGEYIELARWHVARRRGSVVLPMLRRMLIAAEEGGRVRSVVELLVLQALARQQEGDVRESSTLIESALRMAGIADQRLFLDAGRDLTTLLGRARRAGRLPEEARELLEELGRDDGSSDAAGGEPHATPGSGEPLSRQELEVLRLLGAGYSNRDIAGALFISGNTVKTHLRHIYAKLGVKSRTAAVSRAAKLQILEL